MKLARSLEAGMGYSLVVEHLEAEEEGNRKLVVGHSLLVGCRLVVVNTWAAGGRNSLAVVHSLLVVVHNLEAAMQDMMAAVGLTTVVSKEQ
jgi:hypothetical protein